MKWNAGRVSFLRQSAWMVTATLMGGVAMVMVHAVVRARAGADAYAEFKALMSSFYLLAAAGGGLWTLFAQRTAAAVTDDDMAAVASGARLAAVGIAVVWAVLGTGLWLGQDGVMRLWKVSHPGALWATWGLGLLTLWVAIARGVVQGRQDFLSLGSIAILDGVGRFIAVALIVILAGGLAAGAITGAVMGCAAALAVGLVGGRHVLRLRGGRFDWAPWLRAFLPLTLAAGAIQVLQQYDNMYWQALVPTDQLDRWRLGALYSPAQTVGFGITQFTIPLALVMLPRVARSAALGQRSDMVRWTVACTWMLGGSGALVCTVFPKLPLQVMFLGTPDNWEAAPLVPWFAWGMLFMTVAWVYLNDLFARARFAVVPWVVGVALMYAGTLTVIRETLLGMEVPTAYRTGVQILAGYNLVLMGIAWQFSRRP
jgi:hypothetical protein